MSRRFCAVPAIIRDGGAAFAGLGTPKNGGTRMFCLSGHVNKPGVYELPLGFNLMQMIDEVGGGMREREETEGGHSRADLLPGAEGRGDAISPMDYDSRGASRIDAGFGRRGRHGRRHLHGESGAAHHALLRA